MSTSAEIESYLKKHNVENLLKDVVVQLCKDQPEDVISYLQNYLAQKKLELNEEGDEFDEADTRPPAARRPTRRGGVSADPVNVGDVDGYVPKV